MPPSVERFLGVVGRVLLAAVAICATVYLLDYLSLRLKIPSGREPLGSVVVQRSYAVTMKNKKTEFMFDPPQSLECVNSLFPHLGDSPCWYLEQHRKQRITVGAE